MTPRQLSALDHQTLIPSQQLDQVLSKHHDVLTTSLWHVSGKHTQVVLFDMGPLLVLLRQLYATHLWHVLHERQLQLAHAGEVSHRSQGLRLLERLWVCCAVYFVFKEANLVGMLT